MTNLLKLLLIVVVVMAAFVPAVIGFVLRFLWVAARVGAAIADELIRDPR